MQYTRKPTTIDQQIDLLRQRGMEGDEKLMRRWLETVGYYRLSAYWLPWEYPSTGSKTRTKKFPRGTQFADIIDIYVFDRKLRLMTMEAIDRFEIAVRARWTNRFALAYGCHAHMESSNFLDGFKYAAMYSKITQTAKQSSEVFIEHYLEKYSDPYLPPLWSITELMTLGEMSMWVKETRDNKLKDAIARDLGLPNKETMEGSLQLLSYIRNICAHHSRLWNRRTVKRSPNIKAFSQDMNIEIKGNQHQPGNSIYNVLVLLSRTLRHQSPDTSFPQRVTSFVNTRPDWQQQAMGFPEDWQSKPLWQNADGEKSSQSRRLTDWLRNKLRR